ncbi:proteasomal ubiquitin receptor ADRM1-A-like isoform X2 [Tachypleus tridentatus]|uniref:proteasomal ubiquitin receptor ADRM1-A-like isoform X2 n=1 Tax=Tachypleus tridentatus TaxID=6853 RepID=UPI003FD15AD5
MARPFLFGNSGSSQGQSKYLVEFRAGKMTMKGNMVHPDKRKGLVYVYQADDSLMHFCWKDRSSGSVEDDLIIFPDDVEFRKVQQCTTGRVFVLKFKSSSRKYFYWMQEPKTDKDDENCNKVNEYLNNPPAPGSTRSGIGGGIGGSNSSQGLHSELSNLGDGDLHNLLNNISQQQLMQLLGGVGGVSGVANLSNLLGVSRPSSSQSTTTTLPSSSPSTQTPSSERTTAPTPSTPAATTTTAESGTPPSTATQQQSSQIQLQDLQSILSSLNVPTSGEGGASGTAVDLSSALTAEALHPLLSNQEFMDRVCELLPPSGDTGSSSIRDHLRMTVQSPQFQQALGIFSAALQSGQLGPLMQQFGMTSDVVSAATSGDMEAFVRALQNAQGGKGSSGGKGTDGNVSNKDKDKDPDEEMSLD